MAVTKRARFEVFRRDAYTCRYCRSTDNPLTIDHVLPVALGGSDQPDNLVSACKDCNAGKSSASPDAALVGQVSDDAVRWAAARKKAIAGMAQDRKNAARARTPFLKAWKSWDKDGSCLPRDWKTSFDRWLLLGLSMDQILEAHDIAAARRQIRCEAVFSYMAGVLANRLRELEERTSLELVLEPPPGWGRDPVSDALEGGVAEGPVMPDGT